MPCFETLPWPCRRPSMWVDHLKVFINHQLLAAGLSLLFEFITNSVAQNMEQKIAVFSQ